MTRRRISLLVVALLWMGGRAAQAAPADVPPVPEVSAEALEAVRHLAVQHGGRVKPFDSFARETLDLLTGSPRLRGADPTATVMAIAADPSAWTGARILHIPYGPLREPLGLGPKTTHVSLNDLMETRALMRMLPAIVEKQREDEPLSILENETMDVYQRFVTINELIKQQIPMTPTPGQAEWPPVPSSPQAETWSALVAAFGQRDSAHVLALARQLEQGARGAAPAEYPAPWRMRLEVFYNRSTPFRAACGIYLLAVVLFAAALARRLPAIARLGTAAMGLALAVHVGGIACRVILGGRPPVSNFFETMLWLPLVAVVMALVFERIYRAGYFGLAASLLAAITLWLADFVPLDSSIVPVVAVLRSNLWLTIHVLTIVASYGALALATVLAHIYGWLALVRGDRSPSLAPLGLFLYRAIQVGVVLLAAGVMLGAVWANASWGRYWGWDPKETWALITLLWFLAILHGRFAGWIKDIGVALATVGGFFLLLMTYYGVSFYLVGLHSYAGGHAKPLPGLLVGYLIADLAFIAVVGMAALRRKRPA
jgi:cytochrome c-type biogenesis protein CcsB